MVSPRMHHVATTGLSWRPSLAPTSRSGFHHETTPLLCSDDAVAPELRPLAALDPTPGHTTLEHVSPCIHLPPNSGLAAAATHPIALVQRAPCKASGHCRWWPAGTARPTHCHLWRAWPAGARAPVLPSATTVAHIRTPAVTTTTQVTARLTSSHRRRLRRQRGLKSRLPLPEVCAVTRSLVVPRVVPVAPEPTPTGLPHASTTVPTTFAAAPAPWPQEQNPFVVPRSPIGAPDGHGRHNDNDEPSDPMSRPLTTTTEGIAATRMNDTLASASTPAKIDARVAADTGLAAPPQGNNPGVFPPNYEDAPLQETVGQDVPFTKVAATSAATHAVATVAPARWHLGGVRWRETGPPTPGAAIASEEETSATGAGVLRVLIEATSPPSPVTPSPTADGHSSAGRTDDEHDHDSYDHDCD